MKQWALAAAMMVMVGTAQACEHQAYSATLGSVHLFQNPKSVTHHNGINPGLGVECDSYQVGAYYNSIGKWTVYAGRVVEGNPYFGLKYGLATGYLKPVIPYVAGYVRLGEHWELTAIPKTEYNPLVVGLSVRW
jgi:hypothetical protein